MESIVRFQHPKKLKDVTNSVPPTDAQHPLTGGEEKKGLSGGEKDNHKYIFSIHY